MSYYASPFDALNQFNRELGWVLDERPRETRRLRSRGWTPQADVVESEHGFRVAIDMPGVNPEDVEISLHKGLLTIRGERKFETESEGSFTRRERFHGTFARQFTLPDSADEETVSAKSNNGVLEITIPKAKKAKPISITVEGE